MCWWEKYPGRFLEELEKLEGDTNAEIRVMDADHLPGGLGSGLFLAWEEVVKSNSGKRYRILIVCQHNHPCSAPASWIIEPKIDRHCHMLHDRRLSLHDPRIGPDETWVLNIRNWTCEWIQCYETGKWPGTI